MCGINSVKLEAKAIIYKKRKGRRISLKRSERKNRRQNNVFLPLFLKKRAGCGAEPQQTWKHRCNIRWRAGKNHKFVFRKPCRLTAINSVKLEAKAIIYKKRKGRRISLKRSERKNRRQNNVFLPLFLKKRAGCGAEPQQTWKHRCNIRWRAGKNHKFVFRKAMSFDSHKFS